MEKVLSQLAKAPRKFLSIFFPKDATQLGTFSGVYVPSILMMLGVILYLRLGWITGNVGAVNMALIISLSLLIMVVTALSMTSIVSNMKIGGGGAYYMISRSLGFEAGSAIGIALFLCSCVTASMCISGFAESLHQVFPSLSIRNIEVAALTLLALLSLISTNLTLWTQFIIFFALLLSFFSIFTGKTPTSTLAITETLPKIGFWGAFAMFYPAMTGIEVGMAMSGNLKNPARSLPIGIISSLLTVFCIYLGLSYFLSLKASPKELMADFFIVYRIASIPSLILIGIWGATLSSSLSCFLSAPRMLHALAEDGLIPKVFAKTFGKNNEPRIALFATFLFALIINLTTTINQIIPLVSLICLISYGSLNFVVYFEELLQNPSWRPRIRLPWFLPLLGGLGCLATMWMISPALTWISFFLLSFIYVLVSRKNAHKNFQDMRFSMLFSLYRKLAYRLAKKESSARNWRPHLLSIVRSPLSRENMIHFSHSLSQGKGYLVFAAIFPEYFHNAFPLESSKKVFQDFLEKKKIPSLVEVCTLKQGYAGVSELVRAYSFGILQPNTVLLPFPENEPLTEFSATLQSIYQCQKNVLVFKDGGEQCLSLFSESKSSSKTIDIWWEGQNRQNLDLIFSLISVLKRDLRWKKCQANLKMIVFSPHAKENLENYLHHFLNKNRIALDFEIYMEDTSVNALDVIPSFSKDADLVFLGLKKPDEDTEAAALYYEKLFEKTSNLSNLIYVLHGEKMDFREMWDFD